MVALATPCYSISYSITVLSVVFFNRISNKIRNGGPTFCSWLAIVLVANVSSLKICLLCSLLDYITGTLLNTCFTILFLVGLFSRMDVNYDMNTQVKLS